MAIDKKLQIFDDEGNPVDYDILASDVKFNDGKDLPTKLDEMEDEIGEGGYTPPQGGIPKTDLAQSVQDTLDDVANKVDKETGKGLSTNDYTAEDKTKLAGLPTNPVQSISVNGTAQTKDSSGNVNIQVSTGDQVSVIQPDPADGTFTIRVGSTDYTINLNHTHENMAKLEKHTPSTLPDVSEMEDDTIYAEVEDGEVSVLYIGGVPFYGGGGTVSGPVLRRPADGSTIDMGETVNGSVSKTINVKGKNLTQALTIELDGTGYAFGNTQPSGVTIVSTTELTVTAAAANALSGVDIVVVYTGNAGNAEASLGITSGSPDNISCEATLVANNAVYEDLAGVKLTGSQWMQTDYKPNANTEFVISARFVPNSNTRNPSAKGQYIFNCPNDGNKRWVLYTATPDTSNGAYGFLFNNEESIGNQIIMFGEHMSEFTHDPILLSYEKGSSSGTFKANGGVVRSVSTVLKTTRMAQAMSIGYHYGASLIYNVFDLTIYSIIITEGGNEVRHWVPKTRNGIPGLYDTVNGTFISSETSTELVAVPLT